MKAVIAGGGVGGLTAALCLHRIGWEVTVLERADALREVGAGLQISPNGARVLAALGLLAAVEARGHEPETLEMRLGVSGRRIFSLPAGAAMRRRYGAPYLQIHRADLLDVLAEALAERAPGALRLGVSATGYETNGETGGETGGETNMGTNGETGAALTTTEGAVEGDLILGADGVHSALRTAMLGPERPRFTGNVAWRGVVPAAALEGAAVPQGACVWAGAGRHAVTYPLAGGATINFVGVVERDGWETESWTEPGAPADVMADFEGWAPPVRAVIAALSTPFRWALHDRAPLPRWSDGPVGLLGDACHPMLPSFAQGACQAMEDAFVLARHLERAAPGTTPETRAGTTDVAAALSRYFAERAPRTAAVQRTAAANVRLFHKRSRLGRAVAYGPAFAAGLAAPGLLRARLSRVYAHDVTAARKG